MVRRRESERGPSIIPEQLRPHSDLWKTDPQAWVKARMSWDIPILPDESGRGRVVHVVNVLDYMRETRYYSRGAGLDPNAPPWDPSMNPNNQR